MNVRNKLHNGLAQLSLIRQKPIFNKAIIETVILKDPMKNIIIIGNGVAGVTAARNIRKHSDDAITIISSETKHFFSRTALMYIYMGHMKFEHTQPYEDHFWEKNRITLLHDRVTAIDFTEKRLTMQVEGLLSYDSLVLAVGSKSNKFGWPGQDLLAVQGLYSYQDLQSMEALSSTTKHAVIIGGGLIGIEMGEMFHTRGIEVTFLVREASFWNNVLPPEESEMINKHIRSRGFKLMLEEELDTINDDGSGRVGSVLTKSGETIACQFVGLTVGVSPNVEFLKESELAIARGIKVNEYFETNQENVYAIGDCAEFEKAPASDRRNIEQVWYTGRMHGETLAQTICGKKTAYRPGVWFNSAKFLEIEYQIYGQVSNFPTEEEEHFYWEHPNGEKSIRLIFHKEDETLKGINLMGVRYRHEVADKMIKGKWKRKKVFEELKHANFDPEFFKRYEPELVKLYNERYPSDPIKMKREKILGIF
jgi:NAD(P)H-nitrite reductase large subunit